MRIPDHYLRRPATWQASDVADFERLFVEQISPGTRARIQYHLAAPKWQFLCWMTESKNVVLHGGNGAKTDTLEPHQADDVSEFGARNAVLLSGPRWRSTSAIFHRRRHKRGADAVSRRR